MARLTRLLWLSLLSGAAMGATEDRADLARQAAGDCARCHVISVVEWSCSGHWKAGTDCIACHGASRGHVIDERNNIKPDKLPRLAEITKLCFECHQEECPSSKQTGSCQTCHHVHALMDPRQPATVRDEHLEELVARWERHARHMETGEEFVRKRQWAAGRAAFEAALRERPRHERATARLELCQRRLNPGLPGFEAIGTASDEATGLPSRVRVSGLDITMILVTGAEFELGSDDLPKAKPPHQVRVAPFYLAQHELTQNQWQAVMGSQPSAHRGTNYPYSGWMPVEQVSWQDAQAFTRKLNDRVPGGDFRLPTEAEWEYVARAGGEDGEAFDRQAPRVVEQGSANRLGFFDLAGNVREWCSSLMLPYPYNPEDGREAAVAEGLRVLRGGAFCETMDWYAPALRHGERPARRLRYNGMRLARGIPGAAPAQNARGPESRLSDFWEETVLTRKPSQLFRIYKRQVLPTSPFQP